MSIKVLFVAGGNVKKFGMPPFIKAQGKTLENAGIDVKYFPIVGKGIFGYLSSAINLRKYLKENPVDVVHSHFVLSGLVSLLTFRCKKIVLSLMGTDAYGDYIGVNKVSFSSRWLTLLTILIQPFVSVIISKSSNIEKYVWQKKKSFIVPNGIDLNDFSLDETQRKNKKYKFNILFLGDKNNKRKNFSLVEKSLSILNDNNISLHSPYPVPHSKVVSYLNSADLLVFPSCMEGSPNLVKEAMACNCPVVATNVGDIEWLFGDEPGYFISDFTPEDFSVKIKDALEFSKNTGRTRGRERLVELGLDSETVANKIIDLYKSLVQFP